MSLFGIGLTCSSVIAADEANRSALRAGTISCARLAPDALTSEPRLHPLKYIDAVPAPLVSSRGNDAWQVSLTHANQFMGGSVKGERLLLDGETTEIGFERQSRLTQNGHWLAGVRVPIVHHGGGEFDNTISNWHGIFGMPDANRSGAEEDVIAYVYERGNGERLALDHSVTALSDIIVSLLWKPSPAAGMDAGCIGDSGLWRLSMTLPTGSLEDFTGSGNLRLAVDWQSRNLTFGDRWRVATQLGAAWLGQDGEFGNRHDAVAYGTLGLRFRYSPSLSLRVQFDAHSPYYASELRELGDPGVTIATGFDWRFATAKGARWLEVSLVEDIAIDTAADVAVRLAFRSEAR